MMYTFVDCVIVWGSGLLLGSNVPCLQPGVPIIELEHRIAPTGRQA